MTAVPGGLWAAPAPVAVALAFCPSAPLLLPVVEGRPAEETSALRRACDEAVAVMLAVAPGVVVVVADGAAPGVRFGSGDVGDLRGFGVDVAVPFAGPVRDGARRLPTAHTIGAWLLDRGGFAGRRIGVGPGDVRELLEDLPGPVGVLVMGDGSARRTVKAPGYLDEAAAPFDAVVGRALASGNPAALAALDPAEGERLLAAGVPAWRAVGEALAGRTVTARLHLDQAPFGVGYLVADWLVA
ncbi:MAG: hypothetical protein JF630_05710 [Geodermatophilales bacterium]|nr:hypothetical protein [Geodermatophilales bacterium]